MDEFGSDDDGTREAHRARVDARDSMFLQARMRTSPDQDGTPMRVRTFPPAG